MMTQKTTLVHLQSEIESSLTGLVKDHRPDELYDSVRYVISGGGKRLRPVLLLLSAKIFDVSIKRAMPLGLAVELIHNFSLVHDDIMDHADSRRGRKTVHVLWGIDTAILCGDVLLALASECISQASDSNQSHLTRVYGTMIRELCEGQALDMHIGLKPDLTTDDYLHMVDGKTGGLISASLEMGGIIGNVSSETCMVLREAGKSIGRAFQILDDLLDLVADDHRWGKVQGGDLIEGKGTYLLAESRLRSKGKDAEFFAKIRPGDGLSPDEIPVARSKMEALGVLYNARQQVQNYTNDALTKIKSISGNTEELEALITDMAQRIY
ncbi:MAG: polyprenyl synthetase family protein [Bacteroidetes bacterium]|nr:polyprenyl synthetase family protein [Bacteroidota bacterium]MCY4234281.1 polyprenyl synthetase family protein [Bacteroidota bacterium]